MIFEYKRIGKEYRETWCIDWDPGCAEEAEKADEVIGTFLKPFDDDAIVHLRSENGELKDRINLKRNSYALAVEESKKWRGITDYWMEQTRELQDKLAQEKKKKRRRLQNG